MRSYSQTRDAIKSFIDRWKGRGYNKGESQSFWLDLLQNVLEIKTPQDMISFENQPQLTSTSLIDAYIAPTKVLIKQKSIDKDLRKTVKQCDGTVLSPFQQAKRYAAKLPVSKYPRWVVTCNFQSFLIYDMENSHGEPEEVLLENLEKDYYRLSFLVEDDKAHLKRELEISLKAGALIGKLYDAFLKQYGDHVSPQDLHALEVEPFFSLLKTLSEEMGISAPLPKNIHEERGLSASLPKNIPEEMGLSASLPKPLSKDVGSLSSHLKTISDEVELLSSHLKTISEDARISSSLSKPLSKDVGISSSLAKNLSEDAEISAPLTKTLSEDARFSSSHPKPLTKDVGSSSSLTKNISEDVGISSPLTKNLSEDAGSSSPLTKNLSEDAGSSSPLTKNISEDVGISSSLAKTISEEMGLLLSHLKTISEEVELLSSHLKTISAKERARTPGYMTSDAKMWFKLKERARDHRKNPTKAEDLLWQSIRNKKLGYKFRRQHPIHVYIPDFVCLDLKLIIEVDGGYHEEESQRHYDLQRTRDLNALGYHVIRFTNDEVLCNLNSVINSIQSCIADLKANRPKRDLEDT